MRLYLSFIYWQPFCTEPVCVMSDSIMRCWFYLYTNSGITHKLSSAVIRRSLHIDKHHENMPS